MLRKGTVSAPKITKLDKDSRAATESRQAIKEYEANQRAFVKRKKELTRANPKGGWVVVYDSGKFFHVADTKEALLRFMSEAADLREGEFVTTLPETAS